MNVKLCIIDEEFADDMPMITFGETINVAKLQNWFYLAEER